ncbi:hypothetical protein Asi02nite_22970 [Asanoa siamensis]|uniref:Uncharacterized protein n=1 Tax=Asanoa siamensis TaxID=926357 RepID=A0ABQ4CNB8_9ACTN|nr:hypothetical protein Asi02nite_22970 [Asanoa siamensis]
MGPRDVNGGVVDVFLCRRTTDATGLGTDPGDGQRHLYVRCLRAS